MVQTPAARQHQFRKEQNDTRDLRNGKNRNAGGPPVLFQPEVARESSEKHTAGAGGAPPSRRQPSRTPPRHPPPTPRPATAQSPKTNPRCSDENHPLNSATPMISIAPSSQLRKMGQGAWTAAGSGRTFAFLSNRTRRIAGRSLNGAAGSFPKNVLHQRPSRSRKNMLWPPWGIAR